MGDRFQGSDRKTGAHERSSSDREAQRYTKNRTTREQLHAKSIHRKATREFSRYDTSAVRPKKSIVPKVVIGIVVILVLVGAGYFIYTSVLDSTPRKTDIVAGQDVEVTIPEGASASAIAQILYDSDVVADDDEFISAVAARDATSSLRPGTYQMTTLMDMDSLITMLIDGPTFYGNKLVIPEGQRIEETAAAVEAATSVSAQDFIDLAYSASDYVEDYPFLEGVYNNSMEGFLFPKTYDVPEDATADDIITMMLDQFEIELNQAGVSLEGTDTMSLFEIVTVASMIEGETSVSSEMPIVASVIYNRLAISMRLQIDATVVYAMGDSYTGGVVTYDDLEIDSPYNTYLYYGLPPGPISSPGIETILAAIQPEDTDYLYYVALAGDGTHEFFTNYDEFLAAQQ